MTGEPQEMARVSGSGRDVRERRAVCILSPMRSGSTLLKALLAVAEDVSELPEVNFQRYGAGRSAEVFALCRERIVVLKRPCWLHETRRYPRLGDFAGGNHIVLVRDALPTVESLKSMLFGRFAASLGRWWGACLLERYWAETTGRLAALAGAEDNIRLVRYEDLVARPVEVTEQLFQHIGSERRHGTDRYTVPKAHRWRWGRDDGGKIIRSLRVQPAGDRVSDQVLQRRAESSERVASLRRLLGYAA